MIIANLIWHVEYGRYGVLIFIQYTALTLLSFAIGLWMGLGMKNFIVIKNFMNLPIFLFAIMAGCFYPIGTLNNVLDFVIKLSPLTWINRGSFLSIYDGDRFVLVVVIGCLTLAGILCGIGAMVTFRKEDFLYGDLLNSQK
jgi:ABC-2 type transport system permease protein